MRGTLIAGRVLLLCAGYGLARLGRLSGVLPAPECVRFVEDALQVGVVPD